MSARIGYLCTEHWLGLHFWRVMVLRETAKRYLVRTLSRASLPRRGWVERGTELFVPKVAVTFDRPAVVGARVVL